MSQKSTFEFGKTYIEGDFIGQDKIINITQIIQLPPFSPPPDLEGLKADYLAYLQRAYKALDFKGIPQFKTIPHELMLEEVYVPLMVVHSKYPARESENLRQAKRESKSHNLLDESVEYSGKTDIKQIRIEEAIREKDCVIVLGDPGSGKSTLLKYLTLKLSTEEDAPLPILIPLNAFARSIKQNGDGSLQSFFPQFFAHQAEGVADLEPLFKAAIENGQALILLDGLDEVQEKRSHLVHKVEIFAKEAREKGNKVVVTSRIEGYKEVALNSGWKLYKLLGFSPENIKDFAKRWCRAFEKSTGDTPEVEKTAEKEEKVLLDAINANAGVGKLAANPLLLTILALIKRQDGSLPNRRVELYELYLKTLINSWNKARALDQYPVGPELNFNEIMMVLGPLALWLREKNPTAGVVSEEALIAELTRLYMGEDWGEKRGPAVRKANEFLHSIRGYSNLLVERGTKLYGFLHLTFEEMLAAYGIYQLGQLDLQKSLDVIEYYINDPGWRETTLLFIGVWGLANKQPRVAGKVVRGILEMGNSGENYGNNILLAGACLEDVGEEGIGKKVAGEVIDVLKSLAYDRKPEPQIQKDAGFCMGRLADGSTDFLKKIRLDLDDFVYIPPGEFLFGENNETREIKEGFSIAKYPVTNFQYDKFIQAGGYEKQDFWSEAGWAWRLGTYESKAYKFLLKISKLRLIEERHEPFFWQDSRWNNPLTPVVGITWFEAEAYCNWLTLIKERQFRLPTEEEWERVARGAQGRVYPWGDKFNRNKANAAPFWKQDDDADFSFDLGYASTTIVGQFGASKTEGVADLCGNVSEWTGSWYSEDQDRVIRGGSWNDSRSCLLATHRGWFVPDAFGSSIGFRVLSPGSISGS